MQSIAKYLGQIDVSFHHGFVRTNRAANLGNW